MADWVRVKPADGRLVRDLAGRPIAAEGEVLDRSKAPIYWARRERDGDVSIVEAPEPTQQPEAPAAAVEE